MTTSLLSAHLACSLGRRGLGPRIAELASVAPGCAARLEQLTPSRRRPPTFYVRSELEAHWRRGHGDAKGNASRAVWAELVWAWAAYGASRVACLRGVTPLLRWVRDAHMRGGADFG